MGEGTVFGLIQGMAEWLPVSSEGMIVLAGANFFGRLEMEEILRYALFLHLGTSLAALIYFRKDAWAALKAAFSYKKASEENRAVMKFLLVSTAISGAIAFAVLKLLSGLDRELEISSRGITFAIGGLLLITALLQIKKRGKASRRPADLAVSDGIILGLAQGLASLPGLSRSGTTVSALLLRKFEGKEALKLSFLMSIPIVLAGNAALNMGDFALSPKYLAGMLVSFLTGLATIHALLKLAKRVNFGYLLLFFGILMIVASLVWIG